MGGLHWLRLYSVDDREEERILGGIREPIEAGLNLSLAAKSSY